MQRYYFADSCLHVSGDNEFICKSLLPCFKNEASYDNEFVLNASPDNCPVYKNKFNVSTGSGISIDDINGEKWLFSSTDKNNPCCIEAARDCSSLQCYINPSGCTDKIILIENFKQLLRTAAECHLAHHNGVSLHASCITYNGQAVLFTAPSGTGKSTQADIWQNSLGAKIINGDRPFLHLFPDEVRAYGVPWDGKEQIFLQENHPVTAIVEVRQAKENNLRKMSENQAFRLMMNQCFIPMWDDEAKFSVTKTIRYIIKKVPFYRLFCLPQESAANLLHDILFLNQNALLKEEQPDMKLKDGFVLKKIVDEWIVMPTGSNVKKFEGAIVLNEVAAFIWKQLEKPVSRDDLLAAVLDEYDIDDKTAVSDIDVLIDKLRGLDILQENEIVGAK